MLQASFSPQPSIWLGASVASVRVPIPLGGLPSMVIVTNMSELPVFVALGNSSVVADPKTAFPVLPLSQVAITRGVATDLAVIGSSVAGVILTPAS